MNDVWDCLPLPAGTYRYVFAKDGGMVRGTWVHGPQAMGRFAARFSRANCYIQLNPTRERMRIRPHATDVSHLQAILVDIDPEGANADGDNAVEVAWDILNDMGVDTQLTTLIDTGRGRQIWIHIDPLPIIGEGSLARAVKAFIREVSERVGKSYGCVVDTSCSDLARLARLPGTVNQKTGRMSRIMFAGKPQPPWFLFRFDAEVPARVAPSESRSTWPKVVPHLTNTAREFITSGVEQMRRHRGCYAAAKSLHEAYVPEDVARGWLLKGAERCDPPLDGGEVDKIIRRTFGADSDTLPGRGPVLD